MDNTTKTILETLATALSLVGIYFNIRKNLVCWTFWTVGSVLWVVYAVSTRQYGMMTLYVVYTAANWYGRREWIRDEKLAQQNTRFDRAFDMPVRLRKRKHG